MVEIDVGVLPLHAYNPGQKWWDTHLFWPLILPPHPFSMLKANKTSSDQHVPKFNTEQGGGGGTGGGG